MILVRHNRDGHRIPSEGREQSNRVRPALGLGHAKFERWTANPSWPGCSPISSQLLYLGLIKCWPKVVVLTCHWMRADITMCADWAKIKDDVDAVQSRTPQ